MRPNTTPPMAIIDSQTPLLPVPSRKTPSLRLLPKPLSTRSRVVATMTSRSTPSTIATRCPFELRLSATSSILPSLTGGARK
eukprot:2445796-Prymnesium_polylepis.1